MVRALPRSLDLPVFPWDTLADAKRQCREHPQGMIDLSVGSPVDEVAQCARQGLEAAWNSHSYPTVAGTDEVRHAIATWCREERGATVVPEECFPTIGSKELVANLGWQLGLQPGDTVVYPDIAYPTYHICAVVAGARPYAVPMDNLDMWPEEAQIVWLNSPSNPTGHVLDVDTLQTMIAWARQRGAIIVSDECYAPLAWEEPWASQGVPCLISDEVCHGDMRNLLMVYSASKQSNVAGYRASFMVGDRELINAVIGVRRHCGFMAPAPTQAALHKILQDKTHVSAQKEIYQYRRELLLSALRNAGLELDSHCVAGLYLWMRASTKGVDGRDIVARLATLGILVAPGEFYGKVSKDYVRIALTASNEKIEQAVERLEKNRINF
ncbi:MAG: succinyldiaminopimelate transaminase [Actinomycetaceae bacterium]|nr:succinyldiaminopimelate transaminase [Actinomycetaceae bacterium]